MTRVEEEDVNNQLEVMWSWRVDVEGACRQHPVWLGERRKKEDESKMEGQIQDTQEIPQNSISALRLTSRS